MTPNEIKVVQSRLNALSYDAGPVDGQFGGRTKKALTDFQAQNGLDADGLYGPKTAAVLGSPTAKPYNPGGTRPPIPLVPTPPVLGRNNWPSQANVQQVFGKPGNPRCTAGKARLPFPFRLAWDLNQKVMQFGCHELVAEPLTRIFARAVEHYGEAEYRRLGLDLFGGCYNLRPMRGGSTYSMHAYGIAVDLDPERNQLRWGRDKAEFAKPEYAPFWGIVEDEGAVSLGRHANYDWMHFQFARL